MTIFILIALLVIVFLIFFSRNTNKALDMYLKQKYHVFHTVNKLMASKYADSEDVDAILYENDIDLYTLDSKCVTKHYHLNELDELRAAEPEEFARMLNCGYIHNIFVINSIGIWGEFSKMQDDISLGLFFRDCLSNILKRNDFIDGSISYNSAINTLKECLTNIETNIIKD